ncbi:MAG: SagB/ThcOx family dehydrogenase [candidate division Zixibacteria bacterium]|nr:SagB/ThcOx family dehydrogenase [candidate division Zixibacteria bacterium]
MRILAIFLCLLLVASFVISTGIAEEDEKKSYKVESIAVGDTIQLPPPRTSSSFSIEQVIAERRSVREFTDAVISLEKLSQLLWSGQGITDDRRGYRAAPSAGAKYPLEIYVFVGNVQDIPIGLYRYFPYEHQLIVVANYDRRRDLARSIPPNQIDRILETPVVFVIGAVMERTTRKYGTTRGPRYVYIEAGAAAENIMLQAQALYLDTLMWGAFDDNFVYKACRMDREEPILIMPIGYKKKL